MNVLVSSCFLLPTRYDGKAQDKPEMQAIINLLKEAGANAIPVCPEQLGGLSTPRLPAEISGSKVITINGEDVTKQFSVGASSVLKLCQELEVKVAIMKERSPSCGVKQIYDGTHSSSVVSGSGVTTKLLKENGVVIFTENDIEGIREYIWKQKI